MPRLNPFALLARVNWWAAVAVLCSEKILVPTFVLLIHAGVVVDVSYHRPDIYLADTAWYRFVRLTVVATLACYLRTAIADPGLLWQPDTSAGSERHPSLWLMLCCCWCTPVAVAALASGLDSEPQATGRNGCKTMSDMASTPIGVELAKLEQGSEIKVELSVDIEKGNLLAAVPGDIEGIQKRRGTCNAEEFGPLDRSARVPPQRLCRRCNVYQPLRSKHCYDCKRCVRTHDHHCPWVGNCVGERNRVTFLWFLILQATELLIFFTEGVQGISLLEPSVVLLVGLLVIAMFFIMVCCLLMFHFFLMITSLTTWEHTSWGRITYLKGYQQDRGSPFGRSIFWNVSSYCCGPRWCPLPCRRLAAVRYDDDGGIAWELTEPRKPCCVVAMCLECC